MSLKHLTLAMSSSDLASWRPFAAILRLPLRVVGATASCWAVTVFASVVLPMKRFVIWPQSVVTSALTDKLSPEYETWLDAFVNLFRSQPYPYLLLGFSKDYWLEGWQVMFLAST